VLSKHTKVLNVVCIKLVMKKLLTLLFFWGLALNANAALYSFTLLENDNGVPDLSDQLSLDISESGTGSALFTFYNDVDSGIDSSISSIFFEETSPTLFASFSIYDETHPDVDFKVKNGNGDLPGGNNIEFSSEDAYTKQGSNGYGIDNSGESLTIEGLFSDGFQFSDLESALGLALLNDYDNPETFRVGIHVTSINCDGCGDASQSYYAPSPVPLPAAVWLFGSAILGFVGFSRFKKKA